MESNKRLIEVNFPLKQTSMDSVHEKNVRHGHISTLHIWPARRPLAASRAALIATLLPDPGNEEERKKILERLGGHVVKRVKRKKLSGGRVEESSVEETEGGILHWGRESNADLQWFRDKIREAYDGRAPKVFDPFSGGGAIPLEAMRLGCDVTAVDINPVAWFILKCTLEYPQRLAGQMYPLPDFALHSRDFMESYFKAQGLKNAALEARLTAFGLAKDTSAMNGKSKKVPPGQQTFNVQDMPLLNVTNVETNLAWHVRAWGWWVLQQARSDLASFYPTVDDKTTVAYLWARSISCANCRSTVPLLKTRWLCKKDNKHVVLTMSPNAERMGVVFGVQNDATSLVKGTGAQKREHEKQLAGGTMSRSGVTCPCCGTTMTMDYIRHEAKAGRLSAIMTAVVVDGKQGKEYRLPTETEIQMAERASNELPHLYAEIPFGLPEEPLPNKEALGFRVPLYGFDQWYKLFTSRQLLALGTFVKHSRIVRDIMPQYGYSQEWVEAVSAYLTIGIDRLADYNSNVCNWDPNGEYITHTFQRFALPIKWDFSEINPLSGATGSYEGSSEWIMRYIGHASEGLIRSKYPSIISKSAVQSAVTNFDAVITDPPYYDAIPYSDLMDFFYVWLRRTLYGLSSEIDAVFQQPLSPKWDHDKQDGELIDDSSRFGGDKRKSKAAYEEGMFRVFQNCYTALNTDGRLVLVFAHKHPDAWETLVSALIRAGFVVDGSWPIQTEMGNRTRAISSAALASSVWLVCRKRLETARPGWDARVLEDMRSNITEQLRRFWDAGIRGPDFVWAATGPALEAYSKHPVVKKANAPGQVLSVSEFLSHVRRMVADFMIGSIFSQIGGPESVSGLDNVTTYYLLHRKDFGMESTPIGPCILYAVSCNLSDKDLFGKYDLLLRSGGQVDDDEDDETSEEGESSEPEEEGTSSKVRLKSWSQRKNAGVEPADLADGGNDAQMMLNGMNSIPTMGRSMTLIDQVHRLMHLWRSGNLIKVDDYLDQRGLLHTPLFKHLLQALIEMSSGDERSLLESISNHVATRDGSLSNRLSVAE